MYIQRLTNNYYLYVFHNFFLYFFVFVWMNQTQSTDEALAKRDDQHELNQSKPNTPAPTSTTTTTTTIAASPAKQNKSVVQFEQFAKLPDGLCKFVGDLIGTPLDEIDQFYKDQEVCLLIVMFFFCFPFRGIPRRFYKKKMYSRT